MRLTRCAVWSLCVLSCFAFWLSVPASAATPESAPTEGNAAQLVRSALRFEVLGDAEYRKLLLGIAVNQHPDYAPGHWHRGEVNVAGAWRPLASAEAAAAADERLAEYFRRRDEWLSPPSAEGHLKLARVCMRHDLDDHARYHLTQVLLLPATLEQRKDAVRRLSYRLLREEDGNGMLVSEQEGERRAAESSRLQEAWRHWSPLLDRIAADLAVNDEDKRRTALDELLQIDDPEAIPALEALISVRGEAESLQVVEVLARMPQHAATMSLVRHALYSPSQNVRGAAATQLAERPVHDYAPWLLSMLVSPVKSRFAVDSLPDGSFCYLHDFYQPGANRDFVFRKRVNVLPVVDTIATHDYWKVCGDRSNPDNYFLDRSELRDGVDATPSSIDSVAGTLLGDAADAQADVRAFNQRAEWINQRVDAVLERGTGQFMNAEPARWWQWWQDYNELQKANRKPVVARRNVQSRVYTVGYVGQHTQSVRPSCFPAGTPVWTEIGSQPIENLRPGDRVLSQDVETGELTYKIVLGVTARPPAPLLAIRIDGGASIRATRGHPFWVTGTGWKMAKLLAAGERLHGANGSATIESIEEAPVEAAYNLIVEDFATYFVGDQRLLVHDNTLRKPTLSAVPGLQREE